MTNSFNSPALGLAAGFIYLFCLGLVFLIVHRRSKFSFVLLYSEYFYAIGIGFGAILLALNVLPTNDFYAAYLQNRGLIGDWAFIHIIFYSIGMLVGVQFIRRPPKIKLRVFKFSPSPSSQIFIYRILISAGLAFLLIYIAIVGPDLAFTTAAKARAGMASELDIFSHYVFLKNAAQIGTLSIVFFPVILSQAKKNVDVFMLVFYGLALYSLTGARAAIFDTVFLAMLISLSRSKINFKKVLWLSLALLFGVLFTFYGKGLGDQIFTFLVDGRAIEIYTDSSFSDFMNQFIHLIYSIDSGVKEFLESGPFISEAIMLSPLGFMPSWIFSSLGLDFLNWKDVGWQNDIVCLNTMSFPLATGCTIPPYFLGAAAYMGPVLFGFIFGFIRFYVISAASFAWHKHGDHPNKLWIALLMYVAFTRVSLFIPNVIGMFSFFSFAMLLIFAIFGIFRKRSYG